MVLHRLVSRFFDALISQNILILCYNIHIRRDIMSNKVKSDIEIASKAEILPVTTIAEHLGLDADALELRKV